EARAIDEVGAAGRGGTDCDVIGPIRFGGPAKRREGERGGDCRNPGQQGYLDGLPPMLVLRLMAAAAAGRVAPLRPPGPRLRVPSRDRASGACDPRRARLPIWQ